MIGPAVYTRLKTDSTLIKLVKAAIFPHYIPQGSSAPAITYRVDEDERQQTLDGQGAYRTALVAVDCFHENSLDVNSIANAVESRLIDYQGTLGSSTPTVTADHIRLERRFEVFESTSKLFRVSLQFLIGYE